MDSERAATRDDRAYGLSFADALNDCLDAAIITVNHDRIITAFNKQAEKLTDLTATEVLNSPLKSLPAPVRRVIDQTLESGQAVENGEISLDHGSSLRISTFVSMQKGKGSVIAVLHDLAPVEKLERNMRQLDRLASVGALSASMAHEIKNAMVAVRTFVDVLVKENKGGELAPIVSREMRRIDSIVSQMLRLAGPAKPTVASIHIHSVLDHALHLVEHQVNAKKLKTRHEFAASTDLLHGDEYQLQQAFLNLFFNAIEAMEPGGELIVKTEKLTKPRSIRVTVADTGVGIPPGDLGRLFDAFFTTKKQGTGLGLAITRRIVQEHKGTITVESEPKKGTAFHVTLPM
jgi:two-component system, NtrC family, sensor histidine kinase HydH